VGRAVVSRGELLLERSPEARRDPDWPDPVTEQLGCCYQCSDRIVANVLKQPEDNVPFLSLCPTADNAAVSPDRRTDIAGSIKQRRRMTAQEPAAI
jgi:hypothetical protein